MINYFYRCEINNAELKSDENDDISIITFISRPFMSQQDAQDSILADFKRRIAKIKTKVEITSIKEVSPYRLHSPVELEKKLQEDSKFCTYVDTWNGPEGADTRFTFVRCDYYDPEKKELDLVIPPKVFMACYNVSSFEDNFFLPTSYALTHSVTSLLQ